MRARYFVLRADSDREAEVRREPFKILPFRANHVTLGILVLDIKDVWGRLVRFEPEGIRVELRRGFYVCARECSMGKSLRNITPPREPLRRIGLRPVRRIHTAGVLR